MSHSKHFFRKNLFERKSELTIKLWEKGENEIIFKCLKTCFFKNSKSRKLCLKNLELILNQLLLLSFLRKSKTLKVSSEIAKNSKEKCY